MREYFCAYHSMLDATRKLSDAECGRLFRSLLAYSQGRTELINLQGREEIVFDIYSQQIDREIEKYNQICKRNQRNVTRRIEPLPVVTSRNDSAQDKGKGKDKDKEKGKGEDKRAARFNPPNLEDVRAYSNEKGWTPAEFSPERFVDFYASKGWLVGKQPMRDWKAAARGWVSRQDTPAKPAQTNPALQYQQRDYSGQEKSFYFDLDSYGEEE